VHFLGVMLAFGSVAEHYLASGQWQQGISVNIIFESI